MPASHAGELHVSIPGAVVCAEEVPADTQRAHGYGQEILRKERHLRITEIFEC
jgi:predicted nucleic acid-binding Zn ribbon protein